MTHYGIILSLLLLFSLGIVAKIIIIQVTGSEKWGKKLNYVKERTAAIYGTRGNICSHDGKILATSMPHYQLRFDLGAPAVRKTFASEVGELSIKLAHLYGDRSANQFRRELEAAYKKKARYYLVHPRRISYEELKRARKFPIFERGRNKGGFMPVPEYVRVWHGCAGCR